MPDNEKSEKKDFGEGIEVVKDTPHEDKDIEINFGKIFSVFKKKGPEGHSKGKKETKHETPAKKSDDEDVSINLQSISPFIKKWGMPLLTILGVMLVLWLVVDVRLQPEKMPFTNEWASSTVYNVIQSDIQSAINAQYPNLPSDRKNQIVSEEMNKARLSNQYVFKTGANAGQTVDIPGNIEAYSSMIKEFYKDPSGKPYSPDIDPYYWYRYARNIVQKGHIGDEVVDGKQYDMHQVAPYGREISSYDLFFPYFIAYLYNGVRFFNHSADLFGVQTTVYPALLSALTTLLIFLIGKKIAGNTGGFFAAIMAGLHVAYVNRTIHGDNDATVIFFAIFTLWSFVQAIYSKKAIWQIVFGALAGFSIFMFHLAWGGWWFILVFILGAAGAALLTGFVFDFLAHKGNKGHAAWIALKKGIMSRIGKSTITFLVSTILLVGVKNFLIVKDLLFGVTRIKNAVMGTTYWPNVLTTVAELNPGSTNDVLNQIGRLVFWLAAGSAVILLAYAVINSGIFRKYIKGLVPNENRALYAVFFGVLVVLWFIGTVYASTKGIRFVLLLAPMAGLGFGITIGLIQKLALWVNENIAKDKATMIFFGLSYAAIALIEYIFLKSKLLSTMSLFFTGTSLTIAYYAIFLLIAGILAYAAYWLIQNARSGNFSTNTAISAMIFIIIAIPFAANGPISGAYNIAEHDVPIMNDAWYDSLMAINSTSELSAIITSWWDFGHQFTAVADRRVTFDGTTQQYPPAHWVGLFFMTSKESDALGILRMLDCSGGDGAFNEVNKIKNEFHTSIDIVTRLTTIPTAEEANTVLTKEYKFTEAQAKSVLNLTHCNPPEGYVIASEDMIGKSGVWAHFGSWDFEKAIIWSELKNNRTNQKAAVDYMMQKFNYSSEKAKSVFNEIRGLKDDSAANTWISPWPSYSSGTAGCQANQDNTLSCNLGTATLRVNMTTSDAYFEDGTGKQLHPSSFVYQAKDIYGNSTVIERKYTADLMPQGYSVLLVPQGGSYYAVLSSPELAYGMFTRMYYFGGVGLTKFQQISHQQGFTGTNVYVYKALWEKQK